MVRALKTFPDDEVIPPEVCQTLSDILQYDENHRRAIVRAGGVAAIVTTLQTQITNAEICDVCVGILGVLAENSSDASKNRNRMRRAKVRREREMEKERDGEREIYRERWRERWRKRWRERCCPCCCIRSARLSPLDTVVVPTRC